MNGLPATKLVTAFTLVRSLSAAGAVFALAACTSNIGTLDTTLLQLDGSQQSQPPTVSTASSVPVPRPPSLLQNDTDTAAQSNASLTALYSTQANSAEQVAATVTQPPSDQAEPLSSFPLPPIAATTEPTAASEVADQRIAQANAVPSAAAIPATEQTIQAGPVVGAATTQVPSPARSGLLDRLFSRKPPTPQEPVAVAKVEPSSSPATPTATITPEPAVTVIAATNASLPGVDRDRLFGINQETEQPAQAETRPVQVASAAGLARLAPNGLRTQHSGVDVACLKPALVRVLKRVEREFGKPVVVTSGYRSPSRNSNARGAKNSLHIYCAAADIQIEGVSKWDLAAYLRGLPGRGGVGTYCHTKSVHIDIGPRRDWNWRCRRG